MGHVLTVDQQRTALRRIGNILRQFGQDEYPYDPARAIDALQAFSEGMFGIKFPSEIHIADLIHKGWTVVKDVEPSEFNVSDLEFISFLEGDEQFVAGDVMRKRAVMLRGNMGLCDVNRILKCQNEIPEDIRGKRIVLPGTVLRNPAGDLLVPYLFWYVNHWELDARSLIGRDWNGNYRLPCVKQADQVEAIG